MIVEDQGEVIDFLSTPEAYGFADDASVDKVETHISVVFLIGERVFKLKRAVRFAYLDFSTPQLRRAACEAEVKINRRTAPNLYKGIVALTRDGDGNLELGDVDVGGGGEAVDWLVEMSRFDENALFDRLAQSGGLGRRIMEDLADNIASFHQQAKQRLGDDGCSGLTITIDGNEASFGECAEGVLAAQDIQRLIEKSRQALDNNADLFNERCRHGRFKHCHGDLHLRNIFFNDGVPTMFDAIEFNDTFANIDVLYDLSFLLMDLDHRGMKRLANITLNRYLDMTGDGDGMAALPLYLSLRAAIRSHVSASAAASHSDMQQAERLRVESRAYLDLALAYLTPESPRLVAFGGLSGSGKSRLGRETAPFLASNLGARIVRTDVVRKRLSGVAITNRLGGDGYSHEMGERTYDAFYQEISPALKSGCTVVADAMFVQPQQRRIIAEVAADAGVPFQGLWLEASEEVREKRVVGRKRNVSDATAGVVRRQSAYDIGKMQWQRIDSSGPRDETLAKGFDLLGITGI